MAGHPASRGEVKVPMRMLSGWRLDLTLAVRMFSRHAALSAIAIFGITVAIAIAANRIAPPAAPALIWGGNRLSLDVLVEHVRPCSGPGLRALNL